MCIRISMNNKDTYIRMLTREVEVKRYGRILVLHYACLLFHLLLLCSFNCIKLVNLYHSYNLRNIKSSPLLSFSSVLITNILRILLMLFVVPSPLEWKLPQVNNSFTADWTPAPRPNSLAHSRHWNIEERNILCVTSLGPLLMFTEILFLLKSWYSRSYQKYDRITWQKVWIQGVNNYLLDAYHCLTFYHVFCIYYFKSIN